MKTRTFECVLTELDSIRLAHLPAEGRETGSGIDELIDNARIVPSRSVAPDVVTMYTQFLLQDADDGNVRTMTVCYPDDAEPSEGFISVLSPLGMSVIGRPLGAVARWVCPTGKERAAEVSAILFQPEASGDFVT